MKISKKDLKFLKEIAEYLKLQKENPMNFYGELLGEWGEKLDILIIKLKEDK